MIFNFKQFKLPNQCIINIWWQKIHPLNISTIKNLTLFLLLLVSFLLIHFSKTPLYAIFLFAGVFTLILAIITSEYKSIVQTILEFDNIKYTDCPIGIYRTTIDNKLLFHNEFIKNTFISNIEIPHNFIDYLNNMERTNHIENLIINKPISLEKKIELEGNKTIYIRDTFKLIKLPGSCLLFIEGIIEDISYCKNLEIKLKKSQLSELKSENFKNEFLSQISHEIRTPVNTILNYTYLLKESFYSENNNELEIFFAAIEKSSLRLVRTIDSIINLSEVHLDMYESNFTKIDLFNVVLNPILQHYKQIASRKGLLFSFTLPNTNYLINSDKYTTGIIFKEILCNAVKFTNEGEIEISVDEKPDKKLEVTIRDSGIGISENFLPDIFSPFTQEEQGYTRSYEGNGVGLTLVKKYCEINNFEIQIKSKKNEGTIIKILLPIYQSYLNIEKQEVVAI